MHCIAGVTVVGSVTVATVAAVVTECIGLIQGTHHTSVMNKGRFFLITILKKAKKGVK